MTEEDKEDRGVHRRTNEDKVVQRRMEELKGEIRAGWRRLD